MILGINYEGQHDSSVAVIDDQGEIAYAAAEERFSRYKKDGTFPAESLNYYLSMNGHHFCGGEITCAHSETLDLAKNGWRRANSDPLLTPYGRAALLPSYLWRRALHTARVKRRLQKRLHERVHIGHVGHHLSHVAGAYFSSGFPSALIVSLDGCGDELDYMAAVGSGSDVEVIATGIFPQYNFACRYSAITALLGFRVNFHEGKITGLAAYGRFDPRCVEAVRAYTTEIFGWDFFDARQKADRVAREGLKRVLSQRAPALFNALKSAKHRLERWPQDALHQRARSLLNEFSREDLAYAIQHLTEHDVVQMVGALKQATGTTRVALTGGLFANVRLNQRVYEDLGFEEAFVYPPMGDEGLSLGAALFRFHRQARIPPRRIETMNLGPCYTNDQIKQVLDRAGLEYVYDEHIEHECAKQLAAGRVVARFHGRMEFGPRALGNRSILYTTIDATVNDWLNKRLQRTEFMPFAPVTLAEEAHRCYKNLSGISNSTRFMTITVDCTEWMKQVSPAVVHVDGTARPQILQKSDNPSYYTILSEYYRLTGIPSLINTSFNMHEEPIVCSPGDAVQAFLAADLDVLAIGDFLVPSRRMTHSKTPDGVRAFTR